MFRPNIRVSPIVARPIQKPRMQRFATASAGARKFPPVETNYSKLSESQLETFRPHYQSLGNAIKQRNGDALRAALTEIKKLEKQYNATYTPTPVGNWPPEQGNDFYELMMVKTGLLLDSLGVKPGADEKAFFEKYTLSAGFATLEFAFPTPPPYHTFEEAPLIKDVEGATEH